MSSPREVGLEESSILRLIRDYFEKAGHAECQLATENLCKAPGFQQGLPLELSALREMVLGGRWDQVMLYLDKFDHVDDQEGLRRCRYLTHKQKYLEILHHVETDIQGRIRLGFSYYENGELLGVTESQKVRQVVEAQLATLKPLCPSKEVHSALRALLSLPAVSSSRDFSCWQLHSGRLDTMHEILHWVSKTLHLDLTLSSKLKQLDTGDREAGGACMLLRLLARGLLYEQCERLCRRRCGEVEIAPTMLDLRDWIQQQPDSSFQLPPSVLSLKISPWNKFDPPSLHTAKSVDSDTSEARLLRNILEAQSMHSSMLEPALLSTSNRPEPVLPSTRNSTSRDVQTKPREGEKGKSNHHHHHHHHHHTDESHCEKPARTLSAGERKKVVVVIKQQQHRDTLSNDQSQVLQNAVPAVVAIPADAHPKPLHGQGKFPPSKPSLKDPISKKGAPVDSELDGIYADPTNALSRMNISPHRKSANRLSSTPKGTRAAQASLKTPPSSPITADPLHGADGQGARKRLTFQEDFLTATLLGTITDTQVVRSVAFSESGQMVAVGANSGILRLSYTAPLLDKNPSEELEVFYHHPRCHRGSIYCLAWLGDVLLASGSNDKTISLLTLSPGPREPKIKVKRPLPLHSGTIRDLLFTRDGLLIHCGGLSLDVKVTDITTYQCVASLIGHSEQVFALDVLPGGLLASGGQDNTVLLWDMRSPAPASILRMDSAITSMTSTGGHLVTSHPDGTCSLYDLNNFKCLSTCRPHRSECRTVRYQPAHRHGSTSWTLSGSYDKTICLSNMEKQWWTQLCHHTDKVIQCRWHPEGNLFASTGADKKAHFWSVSMPNKNN